MPQKVLCVLSHTMTTEQCSQIRSMHGNNCIIEQKKIRFNSFDSFLKYIERKKKNDYIIYVVIRYDWFKGALKRGYDLGKMYLKKLKQKGKNKINFFMEYYLGNTIEAKPFAVDVRTRNMNCKGYYKKFSSKK